MDPVRLSLLSKSVAFAARFLTPLLFLLFLSVINILKLNEFKVPKIIFDGFCNNENKDGLGRIVCPIVPMRDPFLSSSHALHTNQENGLPILISTTKLKDNVVISADSSTPSSLYLILEVCSNYRRNRLPRLTLLEDLCVILKDSTDNSDIKYRFNRAGRDRGYNEELVKWRNVTVLLQRLPSSGKLPHIRLLSSLNRNKIMSKVLNSFSSFDEETDGGRAGLDRSFEDLLVTSDILTLSDNPFRMLATTAFPNLVNKSFGTIHESVQRLFLSFPEAAAALTHLRKIGFDRLNFALFEPQLDRYTLLAVFLSSLQLLLTYSFDSVHLYNGIVESSYREKAGYDEFFFSGLLPEFARDLESTIFIETIARKMGSFVINLNLKRKLFLIGDIALRFSKKFLFAAISMNLLNKNSSNANLMARKLGDALISLGKFISFDFNNDGIISFEEFTKGSIDMNDLVNDVISAVDSYNRADAGKGDDGALQFVNLLKSQNTLYDKIIDEFIISDTDKNDSLSLEEFMELTMSTSVIENIHA